jgi:hypothetical protein
MISILVQNLLSEEEILSSRSGLSFLNVSSPGYLSYFRKLIKLHAMPLYLICKDTAFENGQRLHELKQTGTTREYICKFRTLVSRLGWNEVALKDIYRDLIKERPDTRGDICQNSRLLIKTFGAGDGEA